MYSLIKIIHVSCVIVSLSGFALRGILKLLDSELMQHKLLRVLPHIVDTFLLASAIALVVMSGMYPWVVSWVGVKLIALIAYILAGSIFMRAQQNGRAQYVWFVVSLSMAGYIVAVALSKSPAAGF